MSERDKIFDANPFIPYDANIYKCLLIQLFACISGIFNRFRSEVGCAQNKSDYHFPNSLLITDD